MLPNSYLKFVASSIVRESKLSKYAKIQLIRFIENASDDQLYLFINEGRVTHNEQISEAFVVPAMLLVAAVSAANLVYDRAFSPAARTCASREQNATEKRKCLKDYRIRANTTKLAALRREMPKCNQTNNIKKCREMFMKKMEKIENQIRKDRSS